MNNPLQTYQETARDHVAEYGSIEADFAVGNFRGNMSTELTNCVEALTTAAEKLVMEELEELSRLLFGSSDVNNALAQISDHIATYRGGEK